MPDLASILEQESRSVEAPDGFERLVRRRDRKRRNRRIGAVIVGLVLAAFATAGLVRAFQGIERQTPAHRPSIPPAAACPPGSTPDEPGPVDQARPPSYAMMAFDRESGRIVLLGPHTASVKETWTFDVCNNTWHQMSPGQEPGGWGGHGVYHAGWEHLVYDADSDLTIAVLGDGRVWAYDLESDTWTEKGRAPIHSGDISLAYDPESGLVVLRQTKYHRVAPGRVSPQTRLWTYDVDTDAWVEIHDVNVPASEQSEFQIALALTDQFVYDASVGRFVAFGTMETRPEYRAGFAGLATAPITPEIRATWTFDLPTATWSLMQATPPALSLAVGFTTFQEAAYDEAAEMTVVYGQGFVGGYDASADRWLTLYRSPVGEGKERPGPLDRVGYQMVYDPTNERLIVYGGFAGDSNLDDVWAFDVATREWTQLLAPSEPQA